MYNRVRNYRLVTTDTIAFLQNPAYIPFQEKCTTPSASIKRDSLVNQQLHTCSPIKKKDTE